jgi:hypothetical protein
VASESSGSPFGICAGLLPNSSFTLRFASTLSAQRQRPSQSEGYNDDKTILFQGSQDFFFHRY